eukprot:m.9274 g.9274  ORF g.9274 m.9274 type:complete len:80 (+) comp3417_c0_seq1:796-1035(+)
MQIRAMGAYSDALNFGVQYTDIPRIWCSIKQDTASSTNTRSDKGTIVVFVSAPARLNRTREEENDVIQPMECYKDYDWL